MHIYVTRKESELRRGKGWAGSWAESGGSCVAVEDAGRRKRVRKAPRIMMACEAEGEWGEGEKHCGGGGLYYPVLSLSTRGPCCVAKSQVVALSSTLT